MGPNDADILDRLNEAQIRAVTTEGPLLIVAGPGTGKTLTMVRRIAHLVRKGRDPASILAVTFTNRAAREMKERTEAFLGKKAAGIFIGTFHLLGLRIIREHRGADFSIVSRGEQFELLKPIVQGQAKNARETAEKISRVKNFLDTPGDDLREIYPLYQSALAKANALDFDDLITVPVEILENAGGYDDGLKRYRYIIVDEYQDINPAQYRMLSLLAKGSDNLCAVGDPDQAIYAFRGANIEYFMNFERDFAGAVRITLTENYRSTGVITDASSAMIGNNTKRFAKNITAAGPQGNPVTILSVPDDRAEGEAIICEIEARMGGTSHYQMTRNADVLEFSDRSYRFSDFAVVYRTNAQARLLEEAFNASGIPYQVIGLKCKIGKQEVDETMEYLQSLIDAGRGMDGRTPNEQEVKLLDEADYFDPRADAVTLMTMHMAKGLEFRVLFIAGCEDGLVPCTLMKDGADIEEERRLFYVGMTRAKEELFLLHARSRFLYGQKLAPSPSFFLNEIPASLIKRIIMPQKARKQNEPDSQLGLFS